ncbi:phage tail protein [Lysinibacillus fusiformis]|uniref:phage tail protein n=1 Tax=Lysinibacillus fusiformis TaxID=28031 RepID=UPI003D068A01
MGTPLMQAVEAVADAQTGELERLKEFGITKKMIIDQANEMDMGEIVNKSGQITDEKKFNEALFALMNERFKGSMEIQATTWDGLISNAQDAMGTMMQTLSQPTFDRMKEGMKGVVPVLSSVTSIINGDWKGAQETLTDTFGEDTAGKIMNFFRGVEGVVDDFKQFILDLRPTFDNLVGIVMGLAPIGVAIGGAIAVIWRVIMDYLPPILEFVTGLVSAIVQWEGFIPILAGVAAGFVAFKVVSGVISGVTAAMNIFRNSMMLMRTAATVLRTGILLLNSAFLANPIAWVVALIVGLVAMFVVLYKRNEAFRNLVNKVWEAIKNAFAATIDWITTTLPVWYQNTMKWFGNLINGIVQWFQNLYAKAVEIFTAVVLWFIRLGLDIQNAFNAVINWFTVTLPAWFESVLTMFGNWINSIVQWFVDLYTRTLEIIGTFYEYLTTLFNNLVTTIAQFVSTLVSKIVEYFNSLKETIVKILTSVRNQIVSIWTYIRDTVVNFALTLWNGAKKHFTNGKDAVVSVVRTAKDNIVDWFQRAKEQTIDRVIGLWEGVKNWIGKLPGKFQEMKEDVLEKVRSIDLYQIGKDIVQGLINGVGSMFSALGTKAKELAGKAEQAIKEKLGIASPSTVTFDAGIDTGQGFINGIDNMIKRARQKAAALASATANAMNGTSLNPSLVTPGSFMTKAASLFRNTMSNLNGDVLVEVPVNLDGREVARGTYRYTTEMQKRQENTKNRFGS